LSPNQKTPALAGVFCCGRVQIDVTFKGVTQMNFKDLMSVLMRGQSLTAEQMKGAMSRLIAGEYTDAQIAAFLMALRFKGESPMEIVAAARVLLKHSVPISFPNQDIVDIAGTGGDGASTFNVSTAAAFVAGAAGVKVVKHCGRSSSGKSGSADVLESLGAVVDLSAEQALKVFEECGLIFLYAPRFNPAMDRVAKIRREMGQRTIFNILGPLINPARPRLQVVGVYNGEILETVALALRKMGSQHAFVVHGSHGVDELSVIGRTRGEELIGRRISPFEIDAKRLGFSYDYKDEVTVDTAKESAVVIESVLQGKRGYARDVVMLNAAAALVVDGSARDLEDGLVEASIAIDSGEALALKERYVEVTKSL
jgi:anthranilate phosphoribosyltransferase